MDFLLKSAKYIFKKNDFKIIRYNNNIMEKLKEIYYLNDIFKDEINISILFNDYLREPIKNNITLDKLFDGHYHSEKSKSDINYAKSIKFFINNLYSFKKIKNNNLDFIYNNFNILIIEYLEYYLKKKLRLTTFKSRLAAILRVLYLMFDNKDFELYKNISSVQDNISTIINQKEGNNKRDELEETKHIDFSLILKRRDDIENLFHNFSDKFNKTAYDINQDLILLSLYSLLPPERCELFDLKFYNSLSINENNNEDYILIENNKCFLILNKIKKTHSSIKINIYNECIKLNDLLIESYTLYKRNNVFTAKNKYPVFKSVKAPNIANRFKVIFKDYNKNIGVNAIRSSYISYKLKNPCITYNQKENIANKMRTSVTQIEKHYKKLDDIQYEIEEPKSIKMVKLPKTEKEIMKTYYEKAKDKIAKQQKEYRQNRNIPAYRIKLIRKLNNDKDYIHKTTKAILDKYNIQQGEDGRYF